MKRVLAGIGCAVVVALTWACSGDESRACEGDSCSSGTSSGGLEGSSEAGGNANQGAGGETSYSGGRGGAGGSGGGSDGMVDQGKLELRLPPFFRLRVGEEGVIPVEISREGAVGEVEIEVAGLPSGVAAPLVKADVDDAHVELTISSLPTAPVGGPYEVSVSGVGSEEGASFEATVTLYLAGAPGSLDESFAESGYLLYEFLPDRYDAVLSIDIDDEGSLLVSGVAQELDPWISWLRRFDQDGVLEADFAPEFGGNWEIRPVISTGSTVSLVGRTEDSTHFVRVLNRDASPYFQFGTGGDVILPEAIDFLAVSGDLRLVGYGSSEIKKLLGDGTDDPDFEYDGGLNFENGVVDPRGRLLLTSIDGSNFLISRLDANGQMDDSFAEEGTLLVQGDPNHLIFESRVLGFREDGGFYAVLESSAGGLYTDEVSIISVKETGELDANFGSGRPVIVDPGVLGIATIDPVRGGAIVSFGTEEGDLLTGSFRRYAADGSVDDEFEDTDLAKVEELLGSWSAVTTLDDVAGRIVLCIGGQATEESYGAVGCARFWL